MKLNKKGYMLVEIVIAFGIAMAIAYYLMNLTYKFKNTNEDIYQSTIYLKDKISITKNIMNDLEKGRIIDYNIPEDNPKALNLTIVIDNEKEPQQRRLEIIDNSNKIIYGKYDGTNYNKTDESYYEKKLEKSLIISPPKITTEGNYFTILIEIESIYDENNYDIKLFGQKDFITVDFDLNYFPADMNEWEHSYPNQFTTTYNSNMNTLAVTSISGWEIVYTPMPVEKNVAYTITFDYEIPATYQASDGIIYQVLKDLPANSDNSSNSVVTKYLPTEKTSIQTATISFTATENTTYYFAFNWGTTQDNVTTTINVGNFKITNSLTPSKKISDNSNNDFMNTIPKRDGYTFYGWYTEKEGGTKIDATTPIPNADTTYYAHWGKIG